MEDQQPTDRSPTEAEEALTRARTEKTQYEARMAKANADRAEIDLALRELEKNKVEAKAEIELERMSLELEVVRNRTVESTIHREQVERWEKQELAKDRYHHRYRFTTNVDSYSVGTCIDQLEEWARIGPKCDLELVLDSPGGNLMDGNHLFDFLQLLKSDGHKITTISLGRSASMAAILFQAASPGCRLMGSNSILLHHKISGGMHGDLDRLEDTMEFIRKLQDRALDILASRAKVSKEVLNERMFKRDDWIDAVEAKNLGLVDRLL